MLLSTWAATLGSTSSKQIRQIKTGAFAPVLYMQEGDWMKTGLRSRGRAERVLWGGSLLVLLTANLAMGEVDPLTLAATTVGVTSLILAAKGRVLAQVLMIVFSLLYGLISLRVCYWGEAITYLGMALPMSVWSAVTWFRNSDGHEVRSQRLSRRHWLLLVLADAAVTAVFYVLLRWLETPKLLFSTLSVSTSFLAAALTMLRSAYYALAYAANDAIVGVLWLLVSVKEPRYLPELHDLSGERPIRLSELASA